jgi:exodeoxyribonuclease V
MMWSPDQERALKSATAWLRSRDRQVFKLFGYAGTGKTELAREVGANAKVVHYAAFTGKAAQVMRQRGCAPVSTIHKLIYNATYDAVNNRYHCRLKSKQELNNISLIIVDEASMIGAPLARDLLSFGIPILIIGDPGQLPPVNGTGFFMQRPDAMLTRIHRQAANHPILRLADRVRRGQPLPRAGYQVGEVLRITGDIEDLTAYDTILVGTNRSRRHYNQLRRRYSFRGNPKANETVVCLRNDYTVMLRCSMAPFTRSARSKKSMMSRSWN